MADRRQSRDTPVAGTTKYPTRSAIDELAGHLVRVVDALIQQRMPLADDVDPWLSVAEAAARAGCSTRSVHRALAAGALVGGRVGRRRRIRASAVDAWVATAGAGPRPALAGLPRSVSPERPRLAVLVRCPCPPPRRLLTWRLKKGLECLTSTSSPDVRCAA